MTLDGVTPKQYPGGGVGTKGIHSRKLFSPSFLQMENDYFREVQNTKKSFRENKLKIIMIKFDLLHMLPSWQLVFFLFLQFSLPFIFLYPHSLQVDCLTCWAPGSVVSSPSTTRGTNTTIDFGYSVVWNNTDFALDCIWSRYSWWRSGQ